MPRYMGSSPRSGLSQLRDLEQRVNLSGPPFPHQETKQTGEMLSQGSFQLQHFMVAQLLISAPMSFIYRENATDTPHVGRVLGVVFPAGLADGQCSTLAPALSPLLVSRSPTQGGLPMASAVL